MKKGTDGSRTESTGLVHKNIQMSTRYKLVEVSAKLELVRKSCPQRNVPWIETISLGWNPVHKEMSTGIRPHHWAGTQTAGDWALDTEHQSVGPCSKNIITKESEYL